MAEKTSAQSLIEKLPIVSEDILTEAAKQPLLFMLGARYRVATMRLRAQASIELDSYRSAVARNIRAKKDKTGQKVTEGTIKELVETNTEVISRWQAYESAIEKEELAKLILEAMRMRRDAIRIIAEANTYEGADQGTTAAKILHQKLAKKAHALMEKQNAE